MNIMFIKVAEAANVLGTNIDCGAGITNLTNLINFFTCLIIDSVIPLLFVTSIAGFVYGILKYFLNPDNEEKRKEGKGFMIWGLIAIFVMVSIWGIVGILSNTFLDSAPKVMPSLNLTK